MSTDTLLQIALALALVCWAVGAHNRLVRLKNAVGQAYEHIDVQLRQRVSLVESLLPIQGRLDAQALAGVDEALRAVRAALEQLRQQPSGGVQALALQAAEQVLDEQLAGLWQASSTLAAVQTDPLLRQIVWELMQLEARLEVVAEPYNQAVAVFNEAAQEFPAWLMARLSALKPLPGLHLGRHGAAREAARPLMVGRREADASAGPAALKSAP